MSMDAREIPTRICPNCGNDVFYTRIMLAPDYTVGMYWLDAVCADDDCQTKVTLATEDDFIEGWDTRID